MLGATNALRGSASDYLTFDQDKAFGSVDLRSTLNQICVLELAGYASTGRYVGLDVKAMRTKKVSGTFSLVDNFLCRQNTLLRKGS